MSEKRVTFLSLYPQDFWSKHAFITLLRSLLISGVFGLIIALILYRLSGAVFLRSLTISAVYASVCAVFVVFPGATLIAGARSNLKTYLLVLGIVLLTNLVGTVVAEIILAKALFNIPFVPLGEDHLLWLNLLLSLSAILIVTRWKVPQQSQDIDWITFRSVDGLKSIRPADIDLIYASNKYVFVCTQEKQMLTEKTLKVFDKELPSTFLRISRSYIVNSSSIKEVEKDKKGRMSVNIKGRNEMKIRVGVTYRKTLREYLSSLG